jgi:hypothetical protein
MPHLEVFRIKGVRVIDSTLQSTPADTFFASSMELPCLRILQVVNVSISGIVFIFFLRTEPKQVLHYGYDCL